MLPSRKGIHVTVLVIGHSYHLEHLAHLPVYLVLRSMHEFEPESDVVIDVKMREKGIALKYCVQGSPVRRNPRQVITLQQYASGVRREETGNLPQKRRLAASGRTEKRHKFTFTDTQIDVLEHLLVSEGLAKVLNVYNDIVQVRPALKVTEERLLS